jgi:MFS transporter, YNFM family, putative membrane transport protein
VNGVAPGPIITAGRLGGMIPFLAGAAAMFATMYSTQAILPQLGAAFGVTAAATGLTVSTLIVALAAGAWIWGPLSDRIGRRRSLIIASGLLVAPSLAAAAAPTFLLLLAARIAQGLCMPGLLTVGVPYIAEVYAPRIGARAMGLYLSALVAGGLVGRVGVSLITAAAGWRVGLAAVAALPLVATLLMRRRLPAETTRPRRAAPTQRRRTTIMHALANRGLIAATIAGSSLFFGFVAAFSYVDFRLERPPINAPAPVASLVFVLWVFGAAAPTAARIAGRVGWRRVAAASLTVSAVGLVISTTAPVAALVGGLAVFAAANFAGVTATQLGVAASSDQDRGVASALYFSCYYLAGGIGGYLPGLAWQAWGWVGVVSLALAGFACGMVALIGLVPAPVGLHHQ